MPRFYVPDLNAVILAKKQKGFKGYRVSQNGFELLKKNNVKSGPCELEIKKVKLNKSSMGYFLEIQDYYARIKKI